MKILYTIISKLEVLYGLQFFFFLWLAVDIATFSNFEVKS